MIWIGFLFTADDDSDVSPHDFEGGGSDFEYNHIGSNGLSIGSHLNIGQHSFSQMQVIIGLIL